jgi:receptor protein-tyrosine kinase
VIDDTSRQLIERAAAHLKRRGTGNVLPMPAERIVPSQPRGGQASTAQTAQIISLPDADGELRLPESGPTPRMDGSPLAMRREPVSPPGLPGRSRQVTVDRVALARNGILIPSSQRSRSTEEFRIIKRHVLAKYASEAEAGSAHRARAIMVTSARPGEGKSFTAISLALSIASEQDLKVLLIDSDTRRHSVQKMMGIAADIGLIDLLSDPAIDFSDVVVRTNIPNLSIMPAGNPDIHIPELLSSRRTRTLFDEMTRRYADRFIIFDAPPCLASSDPTVLAELVGQIVFVVEADRTQTDEIEAALNLIGACPNIGLLLNKVRNRASDRFGSYSDY